MFTRRLILTSALIVAGALLPATGAHAFGVAAPSSDVENEKIIRANYVKFVDAWNAHDTRAMSVMWAIDGDHIEPDGTVAKGRHEVADLFAKQHVSVFKNSKLDLTIESVWFISQFVVLIDGSYTLSGIQGLDGTPITDRTGHLTSIQILEKKSWWIAASRLMIPTSLPYKPED